MNQIGRTGNLHEKITNFNTFCWGTAKRKFYISGRLIVLSTDIVDENMIFPKAHMGNL